MSSIDNARKDAKRWLKAIRDGNAEARARLAQAYPGASDPPVLRDVQNALSRVRGFDSWTAFIAQLARSTGGLTRLEEAALAGNAQTAQRLIDSGAALTPFAAIALDRRDDFERMVLADPRLMRDDRRWGPYVFAAAARGAASVLDRLLRAIERQRAGLSIVNIHAGRADAPEGAGRFTPLHAAACHGKTDAVKILLAHGANPRLRDAKRRAAPAAWAAQAGHQETADVLLRSEVDLFQAIDADRADRIAEILDRDPDALDRPFAAYTPIDEQEGQWWPARRSLPLDWAQSQHKTGAVQALIDRGAGRRSPEERERADRVVMFLQSACWDHHVHGKGDHRMHDRAAQRLVANDPWMARHSLYTAVVCGDIDEVRRRLEQVPEAARMPGGPRYWTPLLYLAYTRFTHPPTLRNAVAIARLLLDYGADPNAFYMAGDARYSVLTGIAGEGEQDSPRQPWAEGAYRLLLERGAGPYDIQVLYNTHFSSDMLWWLQLTYDYCVAHGLRADWDDPAWSMLDMGGYGPGSYFVIDRATRNNNIALVEWALAHGADPNFASSSHPKFRPRRSLYDAAVLLGRTEIAALLAAHGARSSDSPIAPEEALSIASLRLDRPAAEALLAAHPGLRKSTRALFDAASQDRVDSLAFLESLGFSLDASDGTNTRALHNAAGHGSLRAIQYLIDRGVEVDPRETNWGGVPMGWAAHGDRVAAIDLLSRYSHDIWTLCFRGYVERLREILGEDPSLARQVSEDGTTPLWWLPDDDTKAMEVAELLLAAGADPSLRNREGRAAADWARRRGMTDVARRLESR